MDKQSVGKQTLSVYEKKSGGHQQQNEMHAGFWSGYGSFEAVTI